MRESLSLPLNVVRILGKAEDRGPDNPVIGACVCDNDGEYLTRALPEPVCNEIVRICNAHYVDSKLVAKGKTYGGLLFFAKIPGTPMDKPESQVVGLDKNDRPIVCDSPRYLQYIDDFVGKCTVRNATSYVTMPITDKCQVCCTYHCDNRAGKSLPAYVEATLDCLVAAGILKSKGHYVVNNTDGSRIYPDMDKPRTVITIRRWSDK